MLTGIILSTILAIVYLIATFGIYKNSGIIGSERNIDAGIFKFQKAMVQFKDQETK